MDLVKHPDKAELSELFCFVNQADVGSDVAATKQTHRFIPSDLTVLDRNWQEEYAAQCHILGCLC